MLRSAGRGLLSVLFITGVVAVLAMLGRHFAEGQGEAASRKVTLLFTGCENGYTTGACR